MHARNILMTSLVIKITGSVEILIELMGVYAVFLRKGGTHEPTKGIFFVEVYQKLSYFGKKSSACFQEQVLKTHIYTTPTHSLEPAKDKICSHIQRACRAFEGDAQNQKSA
jgi:hypothetical protein